VVGLACLAVLSTLGVIVFPAGDALAGTVTGTRGEVTFSGGAGEANAVVFAFEGPDRIRISDSGAPLTTLHPDCVAAGPDLICEWPGAERMEVIVELNDGNDSVNLPSWVNVNVVEGGPGNDNIVADVFLRGGPGDDRMEAIRGAFMEGGGGDDVMLGGPGWEIFEGGPGNDTLRGFGGVDDLRGDGGDDILVGGLGFDITWARGRNLRLTPTALVGEGTDTLSSIQFVYLDGGGANNVINARTFDGDTRINAFGGDDVIVGGLGRDLILAGPGNDRVAGGPGRDTLWGSAGADLLLSRDGLRDGVFAGRGQDRARLDRIDRSANIEDFL